MQQKLPNFFIVGAPKAGTTSLYYYLKRHPEVFMSSVKEPNFFSYDETVRQNLYHKEKGVGTIEEYKELFATANGHHKAIGEASVSYLFYPSVPEKIKEMVPDAKIIISLRNPVERAYSHYYMEHKLGYVNVPFEDIFLKKTSHKNAHLWYQQYIELGIYTDQVRRYFEVFGKDQVKVFIYDEIAADIEGMIRNLMDFLGLDKDHIPPLEGKYNTYSTPRNGFFRMIYAQKNLRTLARKIIPVEKVEDIKNLFLTRSKKPLRNEETVKRLSEFYRPDIIRLEKLLNKNLRAWYE